TVTLPYLQRDKNLLAFSGGVDSTALFFLLLENRIAFDIALVNYTMRPESDQEEAYAKELAVQYNLKCYTVNAPKFTSHFEENARTFRYNFFESIMQKHDYQNLITAHQLNDQLEWLLMRLTKGAGTVELIGLDSISERQNYRLLRPLLHHSKKELLDYLEVHRHRYFIDSSNGDERMERNYFRHNFSDALLAKYSEGIGRSVAYLRKDKHQLMQGYREIYHEKDLYLLEFNDEASKVRAIDHCLKKLGYLLSAAQRVELDKEKSIVFGGKWAVEVVGKRLFIAPYYQAVIPKPERERYRIAKVPPKVRGYCYTQQIDISKAAPPL
ncbi:MAG TPA: tRNA lysidine(34) synthetase TilS, partial [Campylobacterales bacterium]|nr:tRNA lysidine(34) synthetase TilS [Campylobacterales bacterium]